MLKTLHAKLSCIPSSTHVRLVCGGSSGWLTFKKGQRVFSFEDDAALLTLFFAHVAGTIYEGAVAACQQDFAVPKVYHLFLVGVYES